MTFSTSFSSYVVFGPTLEANSKEKSPLLGYLLFCGISDRHSFAVRSSQSYLVFY
jgi:hypothetical protein